MQHVKIQLSGNFKQSGFGFSCLQKAWHNNITGQFTYLQHDAVEIHASGSDDSILDFYTWCLNQKETRNGEMASIHLKRIKYTEFEIINQL
ncbi:MAG: acylphosphatase [Bacteroidales bacterium]|nr:acylphosphatase [Bacteroidales bacterium]